MPLTSKAQLPQYSPSANTDISIFGAVESGFENVAPAEVSINPNATAGGSIRFTGGTAQDGSEGAEIQVKGGAGGVGGIIEIRPGIGGSSQCWAKLYPPSNSGIGQFDAALFAGSGAPDNANGANGDFCFRSDGGAGTWLYHKDGGVWTEIL